LTRPETLPAWVSQLARPALVLSFLLALAGCTRGPSPEECDQLLDHYTELLVKQENRKASEDEVARLQREARAKAAADREFAKCGNRLSKRQWECAMKAPTVDDVERCLL
jgi:hypothetical protein